MAEYRQAYQRWRSERSTSPPPAPRPGERAASRGPAIDRARVAALDGPPDGPGQVLFGFHNTFPSPAELAIRTAGFDRWAMFTLEQPLVELDDVDRLGAMAFEFDGLAPLQDTGDPPLSDHGRNGAATGAFLRATWPYFYRFLASYDPPLARIMAGQPLVPRSPNGGPAAFVPAASRAEMTFRHTRPGGNVPQIGTDRISAGQNLVRIVTEASSRGTGQIVRIDPHVVSGKPGTFLGPQELRLDLNEFERVTRNQLDEALRGARGHNATQRLKERLNAVARASNYVKGYGEGHGVGSIPPEAIRGVHSPTAEIATMRSMQGIRVAGGILMVYGAYQSLDRVASAPSELRPRVATQEIGGWAGGFGGAWAVGQVFAAAGAALGIETGPGAIITGLVGGLVGGVIGGIGGALGADWVYSMMNEHDDRRCCERAHGQPPSEPFKGGGGSFGGGGASGSW